MKFTRWRGERGEFSYQEAQTQSVYYDKKLEMR